MSFWQKLCFSNPNIFAVWEFWYFKLEVLLVQIVVWEFWYFKLEVLLVQIVWNIKGLHPQVVKIGITDFELVRKTQFFYKNRFHKSLPVRYVFCYWLNDNLSQKFLLSVLNLRKLIICFNNIVSIFCIGMKATGGREPLAPMNLRALCLRYAVNKPLLYSTAPMTPGFYM